MPSPIVRKVAMLLAVAVAILTPVVQQTQDLGISQAAFAAQGDSTLRVAGYAFVIWGLIYAALAVYAVYQLRAPQSDALRRLGWPAAIATAGCAAWIVASSANWMGATVVIILVSAAAAIAGVMAAARSASGRDRWLAVFPVALLAGWLSVAASVNVLTVATAMGLITADTGPGSAIAAVLAVVILGTIISLKSRVFAYPLPIAWGLIGVYVAERADKPLIAMIAAGAAGIMLFVAAATAWRSSRVSV